jgi:hypothetical protein
VGSIHTSLNNRVRGCAQGRGQSGSDPAEPRLQQPGRTDRGDTGRSRATSWRDQADKLAGSLRQRPDAFLLGCSAGVRPDQSRSGPRCPACSGHRRDAGRHPGNDRGRGCRCLGRCAAGAVGGGAAGGIAGAAVPVAGETGRPKWRARRRRRRRRANRGLCRGSRRGQWRCLSSSRANATATARP